jgi:hypothetical protein
MFVTNVFHIKQNRQQIDSQKNLQQIPTGTRGHDPPFFKLLSFFFLSYIFQLLLSVNVDEDIEIIRSVKPVLKGHIWDKEKLTKCVFRSCNV